MIVTQTLYSMAFTPWGNDTVIAYTSSAHVCTLYHCFSILPECWRCRRCHKGCAFYMTSTKEHLNCRINELFVEILRSFQLHYLHLKQTCASMYNISGPVGSLLALPDNDSSQQRPGRVYFGQRGCSKWSTEHGFAQTRWCIVGNDKVYTPIENLRCWYLSSLPIWWVSI